MFVVKVPGVNNKSNTRGCEKAGNEILKIIKEEIKLNESGKSVEIGRLDLEEIHLDNSDLKLTNALIYKNALKSFESKPKSIFLGGDHSISYPLCKAFLDYFNEIGKEPCLIIFDARPNCKLPEDKDFTYPKNEEWLRKIVDEGFPGQNILLVGNRNLDTNEKEFLKTHSIRSLSLNFLLEQIEEACEFIMEFSNKKELYLSLNVNVLDPVFAPGAEHPEVGGLTSREFIYLIQRLNKIKTFRAAELVEINPLKDTDKLTLKIGAKIISELI